MLDNELKNQLLDLNMIDYRVSSATISCMAVCLCYIDLMHSGDAKSAGPFSETMK